MHYNRLLSSLFLVLLLASFCMNCSHLSTPSKFEDSNKDSKVYISAEEELQLRYYLRKYSSKSTGSYGQNLTLYLLIEGSNDLDSVIMICTPEGEPSYSVSMTETSTPNLYTSQLELSISENTTLNMYSEEISRCSVQYYANTTSGSSIVSEVCSYQVIITMLEYDGPIIHFYNTPDLWYLINTTGHEVTWSISEGFPDYYKVYEDDFLIEAWSWNGSVTINVDNLPIGEHVFEVQATAGWTSASETVTVHVVDELPEGVSTGSVGPITNPINQLLSNSAFVAVLVGIPTLLLLSAIVLHQLKKKAS